MNTIAQRATSYRAQLGSDLFQDPSRLSKDLTMTMTVTYLCSPDIRVTELDGEGIVLHLANRRYFTVSSSGLLILNALKTEQTFDHVIDLLVETYDVSREEASETASTFLAQCGANGMVIAEKHS